MQVVFHKHIYMTIFGIHAYITLMNWSYFYVTLSYNCCMMNCIGHNYPSLIHCQRESTSAPWVILVINVNMSLVGLMLLPSMFQISSTMEWHGLEDVEPLQDAEDKGLAQAQSTRLYIFHFSDPRSH